VAFGRKPCVGNLMYVPNGAFSLSHFLVGADRIRCSESDSRNKCYSKAFAIRRTRHEYRLDELVMRFFNNVVALIAMIDADIPAKDAKDSVRCVKHEWVDDRLVGIRAEVLNCRDDEFHLKRAETILADCPSPAFKIGW
jgi:hypothetical protein